VPDVTTGSTRDQLIAAGERVLRDHGYAGLSTRLVAGDAGVTLSQIHYHFGSKAGLVLAIFESQNEKLVGRQTEMFGSDVPLWKQWEQACDYLEDDLASGYVRVLQEMMAAGWSDRDIATAVRSELRKWASLLEEVARRAAEQGTDFGPLTPTEVAALVSAAFLGAEELLLLGYTEKDAPVRSALRKLGEVIRLMEEGG
jgi:AcrR family transcriptional regulator